MNISRSRLIKLASEFHKRQIGVSEIILFEDYNFAFKLGKPSVCLVLDSKQPKALVEKFRKLTTLPVVFIRVNDLLKRENKAKYEALVAGQSLLAPAKVPKHYIAFQYSSAHLRSSARVYFFTELKELVKQDIEQLGPGLLLVPAKKSGIISKFLDKWECKHSKRSFYLDAAPEYKEDKVTKKVLIQYTSSHLRGSEKVKFFYALKGRDSKPGILDQTNSEFLSKGVVLASSDKAELLKKFFEHWSCATRSRLIFEEVSYD